MSIKVIIADDHPLIRSGIRATLSSAPDIEVVAEATDGAEAVASCREHQPDVLLLDLSMPGQTAVVTIERLGKESVSPHVIILTAYDDSVYVRSLIEAGVAGYVLKDETPEALVTAVRAVTQGGTWFSRAVLSKYRSQDPRSEALSTLTPREREVVALIAQGLDNRSIAEQLGLAEQTVRNYVSRVYDKLDLHSRVELAVWAHENDVASAGND